MDCVHVGEPPETTAERITLVSWYLACGYAFTAPQVAHLIGRSARTAQRLLSEMARVVPIYRDSCGLWQRCESRYTNDM